MQRRAATAYVLLFLVLGAGSYGLLATAQPPEVTFENPEHRLSTGDRFTVGDRGYTVASVSAAEESGGTSVADASTLRWTNDSATYTETWASGDAATVGGFSGEVAVSNGSEPSAFTLVEQVNRTAILRADPDADNETVTRAGTEYVVVTAGNTTELVAADDYFPAPETRTFAEGDRFAYAGNRTTVGNVTGEGVTVSWTAPRTNEVELSQRSNVTLAGQTYFVYFTGENEVVLESDYSVYAEQAAAMESYTETTNGLWGVSILSGASAALLVGMAFLPSRY